MELILLSLYLFGYLIPLLTEITLAFEIPTSHNFTASGDGSRFSETVSGASSAKHLIDVSASTLAVNAPTTAVQGVILKLQ